MTASMKRAARWIDLAAFLAIIWCILAALPLSIWFEPGKVIVASTDHKDQPALLVYNREIKRRVFVSYSAVIHGIKPDTIACEAKGGPYWYEPGRDLPAPEEMTLAWWAPSDPRCASLQPGEYVMETCWSGKISSLLPEKNVCVQSNPFTIRE